MRKGFSPFIKIQAPFNAEVRKWRGKPRIIFMDNAVFVLYWPEYRRGMHSVIPLHELFGDWI
jgi:hypothetical protein